MGRSSKKNRRSDRVGSQRQPGGVSPESSAHLKRDTEMLNLTSKAPFTQQFNHSFRQAAARQRLDALRRLAATPEAMQAAWKTYEAALAQAPDDCQLHHRFGLLAMQSGRPDVAVEHLRIAVEKLPLESLMHRNLGNALVAQGRVEEAIVQYKNALEIKPDYAQVRQNL